MNLTTLLSFVALAMGVVVLIFGLLVFGTPFTDIGMLSTVAVFVLFGVFGLLLARAQNAETA